MSIQLLKNSSDLSSSQEEESEDYDSDFINDNDAHSQEVVSQMIAVVQHYICYERHASC